MPADNALAYLSVDEFIPTLPAARALKTAFELGLIDCLSASPTPSRSLDLERNLGIDGRGLRLLLQLLRANHVITADADRIALNESFRSVLVYRDLLEAKLDFALLVAPDFLDHFTTLLRDPAGFMAQSRIFELFGYQHSLTASPENLQRTSAWVRFTTCLTRYEAQACLKLHSFGGYRRVLDIGGNSGEFVLQICKQHPAIHATVFDLPVVCDVGSRHVQAEPEASRIAFHKGNALADPLPTGFDLVIFKSMLHDWPEADARRLLSRASQALVPGGTVLIFERGPLEISEAGLPFSLIPMLLFFRSFRTPEFYRDHLEAIGLTDLTVQHVALEMPFFLVTGRLGA